MRIRILLAGAIGLAGLGCVNPKQGGSANLFGGNTERPPLNSGAAPSQPVAQELPGKPAATLMLTMAEGLEKDGKEADAIAYFEKARELDIALSDRASRRLAVLYDRVDDQARAMSEFQSLLKKKPKDSSLLNDMGYSLYNRAQWAEAENYLRKAVAADKGNKSAWINLGLALAQQNKYQEAFDSFTHAVTPAEAHANVGFVLAVQGKKAEAIASYRRALDLEPALKIAQVAVQRLEHGDAVLPTAGQ